jgi:DnaJ homolog subfamily C member 3
VSHFRQGLHSDPEHKGLKKLFRQVKKLIKFMDNAAKEMEQGAYEDAVEDWKSALEVDPAHATLNKDLWYQLCLSHFHLQQMEKATKACERVIKIASDHAAAHAKISEALLGLEKYEDAVRFAKRASELDQQFQEIYNRAEAALKQSKNKNFYKILGITRTATIKEIKKAYRRQALEWHPDKHADKEESIREEIHAKFHDIAQAYEILSNEDLRARYDRGEDVTNAAAQSQQQQHPFHQSHFFQQGGRTYHFNFGG